MEEKGFYAGLTNKRRQVLRWQNPGRSGGRGRSVAPIMPGGYKQPPPHVIGHGTRGRGK